MVNIYSIYLPAKGSDDDFGAALDNLSGIIDSMETTSLSIVCGDANADLGWLGGIRSVRQPTGRGKEFYTFIEKYNLVATKLCEWAVGPVNTFNGPTGSSLIDYILVPKSMLSLVDTCSVMGDDPLNCSDHLPVCASLNLKTLASKYNTRVSPGVKKWDKMSIDDLLCKYTIPVSHRLDEVSEYLAHNMSSHKDIDHAMSMIVHILRDADSVIPVTKFKKNLKPYWNNQLSALKKIKMCAYRKWVSEGKPGDDDSTLKEEYRIAKKGFASELKKLSQEYESEQISDLVSSVGLDRKFFWRALKMNRAGNNNKSLAIKNADDRVVHWMRYLESGRNIFPSYVLPNKIPHLMKHILK